MSAYLNVDAYSIGMHVCSHVSLYLPSVVEVAQQMDMIMPSLMIMPCILLSLYYCL